MDDLRGDAITTMKGAIGGTTFAPPPPPVFRIQSPDGRDLLYIDPSTATVRGELEDAGPAAAAFLGALRTLVGGFIPTTADDLVKALGEHDWRAGDLNEHGLTCRHADHQYDSGCSICRGDVAAIVTALITLHPATQPGGA